MRKTCQSKLDMLTYFFTCFTCGYILAWLLPWADLLTAVLDNYIYIRMETMIPLKVFVYVCVCSPARTLYSTDPPIKWCEYNPLLIISIVRPQNAGVYTWSVIVKRVRTLIVWTSYWCDRYECLMLLIVDVVLWRFSL